MDATPRRRPQSASDLPAVVSLRREDDYVSTLALDAPGARHVMTDRPGIMPAVVGGIEVPRTTRCGITLTATSPRPSYQPVRIVTCPTCRAAVLADTVTHRVRTGRTSLGSGPIKGQRTRYGTTASCLCGWSTRHNTAPSSGGLRSVLEYALTHLDSLTPLEDHRA